MIRKARVSDAAACVGIYNRYIENTTFTFEVSPVSVEEFAHRIAEISSVYPFFVYEEDGEVLGYCYLSAFSPRAAYRFTCDESIYVAWDARGRGIGETMMQALCSAARDMGYHTVIAVITGENKASCRFHERVGYTLCADIPHVAYKMGKWLGIYYYRLDLIIGDAEPREVVPYPLLGRDEEKTYEKN